MFCPFLICFVIIIYQNINKGVIQMNNLRKTVSIIFTSLFLFSIVGCGTTPSNSAAPAATEKPVTITISAAASLKDAMDQIKTIYAKDKPNVTLTVNLGASGTLEQQIEQGAPADIFISAANKQMDDLKAKNLIDETTLATFLKNSLVLVVPVSSAGVSGFNDLTGDKVKKIAIGEPKSVPAGQYALETFKNLNVTEKLKPKEVQGKDVKEVLSWVETGNADAGIVYGTDAKASTKVKIVATADENTHSPIVYPMAVIKNSPNAEAAKAFLKYLSTDKAKKVFEDLGFVINAK
jgi:molybdate transport system substrate-binding protein